MRDDAGAYKYNVSDREYFKQVVGGADLGGQVVIDKITGESQNCLAVPVKSEENLIGLHIGCSFLKDITTAVVNIKFGETGFALLADPSGQLMANGQRDVAAGKLESVKDHAAIKNTKKNELVSFDQTGVAKVAIGQETDLKWNLVVEQDHADAFATVLASQRNTLILLIVTLVVVLIIAFTLARWLTRPIRRLTAVADSISRGQLDAKIAETQRGDEIGALAQAIERLRTSMKMAFEKLQKT